MEIAERWELKGPFRSLAPPRESSVDRPADRPDRPLAHSDSPSAGAIPGEPPDEGGYAGVPPPAGRPPDTDLSLRTVEAEDGGEFEERRGLFSHGYSHDKFWYLDLGFRFGWQRLDGTARKLDLRLDAPLKLDWAGVFEHPTTPLDRKTDLGLTTQYIGIGRRETDWLTWNFYLGYGSGGDHNHQRVGNVNLEVNFDYTLVYTGLTADVYPWGTARYANYSSWRERLHASRPFLMSGVEFGYLRARGRGHLALAPVKLYRDSQAIEDWLFSWLIGAGWEMPINARLSLATMMHYTFHFYRPEEYNGWNVTFALRYRF